MVQLKKFFKGVFAMAEKFSTDKNLQQEISKNNNLRIAAWNAFQDLRRQTANLPEMSLDDINAEISATRAEKHNKL